MMPEPILQWTRDRAAGGLSSEAARTRAAMRAPASCAGAPFQRRTWGARERPRWRRWRSATWPQRQPPWARRPWPAPWPLPPLPWPWPRPCASSLQTFACWRAAGVSAVGGGVSAGRSGVARCTLAGSDLGPLFEERVDRVDRDARLCLCLCRCGVGL